MKVSGLKQSLRNTEIDADRIRITLDVPVSLLVRVSEMLDKGKFRSRNHLILSAVDDYLKRLESARIDEAFAQMEYDTEYRNLNLKVAEEFSVCDHEASRIRKR